MKNFFKWIRIKAKLRIVWINNWRILQMGKPNIKTIGVLTSGGDAPAMNAAVRAVARIGKERGLKVKGIRKGYNGLLNEDIIDLTPTETAIVLIPSAANFLAPWKEPSPPITTSPSIPCFLQISAPLC